MKTEIEILKAKVEELKIDNKKLKAENFAFHIENTEKYVEVIDLEERNKELKVDNKTLESEIAEWHNRSHLNGGLATAANEYDILEAENKELRREVEVMQKTTECFQIMARDLTKAVFENPKEEEGR